ARHPAPARGGRGPRRRDVGRQDPRRDRRADALRHDPDAATRRHGARRRARGRDLALRVPLLPCRDHLRRHRRGTAQHRRPPPARPGRRVIDAGERALLAATVGDAIAAIAAEGGTADGALTELGWLEMLDAEPRDAVGIVFSALGAQHVTATVLDDVVAGALGIEPRAAVALLLSPYTTWAPPGRVDGGLLHASGVTTARVATADELVVAAEADGRLALATVPASAVTITPVAGIDPAAGLHAVEIGGAVASTVPLDLDAWDAAVAAGRRAL